jgi:membrane protease YdiL (CAAX protease family)
MNTSPNLRREQLALAFGILFPTLVTWVYFVALDGSAPALQQSAYSIGKALQFLFPLVWVFAISRDLLRSPALGPSAMRFSTSIAIGIAFGLLIAGVGLATYFLYLKPAGLFESAAGEVREKIKGLGLASFAAYLALAVFYSLVHSLLEEYYWRWFVFGRLTRITSLPWAFALSSLGFMAHHVLLLATYFGWDSPATYLLSAGVAIGGLAWAWLYRQSGSLIGPWISHALVDAFIFALGYDLLRT